MERPWSGILADTHRRPVATGAAPSLPRMSGAALSLCLLIITDKVRAHDYACSSRNDK